jgi:hypothetical protein
MNDYFKEVQVGDELLNLIGDEGKEVLEVFAKSEDEVVIVGKAMSTECLSSFQKGEIIIANKVNINGVKYAIGDKVKVATKSNKVVKMYVNYLIGKDAIVLSFKKNPSFSSLKWILRLMEHVL